ncbi:MFS transporter [Streptomyces sp. NPDC002078]
MAAQLTALAAALTLAACAAASVAAQASNIAGRHARPGRRGTGVATVSAGMAAGILLSRLAGGALTDGLGWRRMLLVFATLALLGVIAAAALLPRERPSADRGYRAALMSLHPLPRQWGTGEVRPTRRRRGRRM